MASPILVLCRDLLFGSKITGVAGAAQVTVKMLRDELHALQALVQGDRDFLKLMLAPAAQQDALRTSAIKNYQEAVRLYRLHALEYWVSDELAAQFYPPNVNKANISDANLDPSVLESILSNAYTRIQADPYASGFEEIAEFNVYISRALARLNNLGAAQ